MLTEVVGKCSGFIRRGTNTYVCIFSVQARSKSDWKAASNWDASSKPWLKNQNGASQTSKTHSSHVTYPKRYRWRRVCKVDTQDEAKISKSRVVRSPPRLTSLTDHEHYLGESRTQHENQVDFKLLSAIISQLTKRRNTKTPDQTLNRCANTYTHSMDNILSICRA